MIRVSSLLIILLPPLSAIAGTQMPLSTLSNVGSNDQRIVAVAEFSILNDQVGKNPKEMTLKDFIASRPPIDTNGDGKMLCVVESMADPERKSGGMCVSTQNTSRIVVVATFRNATGAPIKGERTMAIKDFVTGAVAKQANSGTDFNCIVKEGINTGVCVIANNK